MTERDIISDHLLRMGLSPSTSQLDKIMNYLEMIYKGNESINLTGTKDRKGILKRHFLDCLSIFEYLKKYYENRTFDGELLDVGTGPGLPGILIAVLLEKTGISLLDSRRKILDFASKASLAIGLNNIFPVNARAEIKAHDISYRERFDIVVSRAVAEARILVELTIPYCKIGGKIILYKSKNIRTELECSKSLISTLGAELEELKEVTVPFLNEPRYLLILKKIEKTPYNYPRNYAKIKNRLIIE